MIRMVRDATYQALEGHHKGKPFLFLRKSFRISFWNVRPGEALGASEYESPFVITIWAKYRRFTAKITISRLHSP